MTDAVQPVRPIDVEEQEHRTPPPLVIVIALLAIGGLIGWGAASFGGDGIATAVPATTPGQASPLGDASLEPEPRATINWIAATSVPPIPDALDYAGSTNVAEVGGSLYFVVRFADPTNGEISNELWSSADGIEWSGEVVDLGEAVSVTEVTTVADGLLMTGISESTFGLWRSIPGRAIDGTSWSRVSLDLPPDFSPGLHKTVVNRQGEITTALLGSINVWQDIVSPYVPAGLDIRDPRAYMFDGSLFLPDRQTPLTIFNEAAELVTTRDAVWIRLVTTDGEEVLQTVPLPDGAYPVESAPDLSYIPIALSWISDDGIDFHPITGRNALPHGYFLPDAWQDGFIAATYELEAAFAPNERVSLWSTASGLAWKPADVQPPAECPRFFIAVSRDRILLTGDDGTRCVGTDDAEWFVLPEPSTVSYAVGGPAGFLGYPDSFDYATASYSRDGMTWVDVTIPAAEPYPTLALLENRLFAMSVNCCDPTTGKHIELWIGEIS